MHSSSSSTSEEEPMITNNAEEEEDVAKFDGKIVYNPDGSAYILEDDNLDILLPKQDGSLVDVPGEEIPPLAKAFYVSKGQGNTNLYNALVKKSSPLSGLSHHPNAPVVHSYRVYSPRGGCDLNNPSSPGGSAAKVPLSLLSVPVKPILMCFICKLSFGCCKSFVNHAVSEHDILLHEEEVAILEAKHSSAIIQTSGRNKEASVSFLEPVNPETMQSPQKPTPVEQEPTTLKSPQGTPESFQEPNEMAAAMMAAAAAAAAAARKSPPSGCNSPAGPSFPTNANMLTGTTIGACPDHVNGRPTGVECPKCDLILNASRMPGGIAWNTSRNSCKTLKCPKCNWHYKYQETLEIHMKEKHPENETTCIYCITGQQHPRLARGETYTCGYKPYRCEVCNYSTTTKGNLSIHMQSDKHLNNMQELQNGGSSEHNSPSPGSPKVVKPPHSSPSLVVVSSPSSSVAPSPTAAPGPCKPNWRCDICNYETNVARNLRIHMTSEKHSQNVLALQQNAKNFSAALNQQIPLGTDPKSQLLQGFGLLAAAAASNQDASAAMADLAYNQALLSQLINQQQQSSTLGLLSHDQIQQHQQLVASPHQELEAPKAQVDPNPRYLFSCCVCRDFGSDSLEPLSAHLSVDRSKSRENEVSLLIAGNYLCQLCSYKTNLKANFQLHCKTDKHLQRLNHVNHIKEGGPGNEWKLRFLSNVNPVELRCNACDFFTNSPHKLQVHVSSQEHQISSLLFSHLTASEERLRRDSSGVNLSYECRLCCFSTGGKSALLEHVRSMKHLQMEQIHQLQKRAEGNLSQTDIGDIFRVSSNESQQPQNNNNNNNNASNSNNNEENSFSNNNSESNHKTEKKGSAPPASQAISLDPSSCPLCSEKFSGVESLEEHASSVHSVNAEGIARLQSLINGSHWLNNEKQTVKQEEERDEEEQEEEEEKMDVDIKDESEEDIISDGPFKCDTCRLSFSQKSSLLEHYNSSVHLSRMGPSGNEQQGIPTPEKSPTKGSALEALLGNMKKDSEDEEVKPYKCNICRVAYSQGSTLDIHIRSVLHQTKASKLQELILSGQIDLSKPLIEQPDPSQLQEQHKKILSDMLSPKSLNSTGSSNPQSSPNVRSSSPAQNNSSSSPQSSPLATSLSNKNNSSGTEEEGNGDHQEAFANLVKNLLPGGGDGKALATALGSLPDAKKANSPVLKNLLSNYGLDFIMQFNNEMKKRSSENNPSESKRVSEEDFKFPCPICKRAFSNASHLKAHSDEAHGEVLSPELMDKYIEKLKSVHGTSDEEMPSSEPQPEDGNNSRSPSVRSSTPQCPGQPPNLMEMQEVIQRAMMQQMNPMMMQMAQLQGLNPLAAMNLYPPLIPPSLLQGSQGLHGGMLDPKVLALMAAKASPEDLKNINPHAAFMQMLAQQQNHQVGNAGGAKMPQMEPFGFPPTPPDAHHHPTNTNASKSTTTAIPNPPPSATALTPGSQQETGGKRARTRISDDQLKILRSHFDINNSPTEDTLNLMASQTGLPLKVIKHWFRNTLFKERQKNKDSPYNFSNPPSTKLNLEEYEKSGETKITPLKPEEQGEYIQNELKKEAEPSSVSEAKIARASSPESNLSDSNHSRTEIPSESSNGGNLTLSRLLAAGGSPLPPNILPNFPAFPTNPAAMPNYLSSLANRMSVEMNNSSVPRPQSPQQSSGGSNSSSGKRANRTRFTDYQIKVLQEFFENNAYPKDDDLEYLSKLLGLSPRVIVVWFQNARQKARKIYENQPAGNECSPVASNTSSSSASGAVGATVAVNNIISDSDSEQNNAGRFTRTPGLNYQCKKCLLVFQRYYELIRHQKQHCYKEEDAKRSAQAQKAAGQAAAQYAGQIVLNSEDSNHSNDHSSVHSPMVDEDRIPHQPFLQGAFHPTIKQQHRLDDEVEEDLENDSDSLCSTPSSKRKLSDDGTELDAEELQNREKRLRTTITQEQLDFLYQKYEVESNPSRKSLEHISGQVGLRKRVVQVWFQNTRARERKGLFVRGGGGDENSFSMKCPMCPKASPFKSRSSWETHVASAHGDILQEDETTPSFGSLSGINLQTSMRKYYEDTMKRFMNDIQEAGGNKDNSSAAACVALDLTSSDMETLSDDQHPEDDGSSAYGGNKRFRTQMTGLQIKIMKSVFESYKTPSMSECLSLGKEIGLQKRVVQVWFQNARAKEKRARLQGSLSGPETPEPASPPLPEECSICSFKYGSHYSLQDHIFSKGHLDKLRSLLESGLYEPESPGQGAVFQAQNSSNTSSLGEPLQMLQINNRDLLDMTSRSNPRMMMQV